MGQSFSFYTACDAPGCWADSFEVSRISRGDRVPEPSTPPGWQRLENRFYCPAHKVTVTVDVDGVAKEVPL